LCAGDEVLTINGVVPRDIIEWRFAADEPDVEIELRRGGLQTSLEISKRAGEPWRGGREAGAHPDAADPPVDPLLHRLLAPLRPARGDLAESPVAERVQRPDRKPRRRRRVVVEAEPTARVSQHSAHHPRVHGEGRADLGVGDGGFAHRACSRASR